VFAKRTQLFFSNLPDKTQKGATLNLKGVNTMDCRILLCIERERNRELIRDFLSHRYSILFFHREMSLADLDFDLAVLDGPALRELETQVLALRREKEPVFVPFLLVTPKKDLHYAERQLWKTIDEIVLTPIEKVELLARVEILLRARRFSLQMRKDAIDQLIVSEERFRNVSQLTSDFAYAFYRDSQGGWHTEWITDAFSRVTGFPAEETVVNGRWLPIVLEDDRKILQQQWKRLLKGEESVSEYRIRAASGDVRWLRDYARPIRSSQTGEVVRVLGAAQDITQQKEYESKLRHLIERLQALHQADRAILEAESPAQIVDRALSFLARYLNFRILGILVWDRDGETARLVSLRRKKGSRMRIGRRFRLPKDACQDVLKKERFRICHGRIPKALKECCGELLEVLRGKPFAIVPLSSRNQLAGLFFWQAEHRTDFTEDGREDVLAICDQLAIALHQARMADRLRWHAEELRQKVLERTQDLAESESRYRQLVESPLLGIYQADLNGKFVFVNRRLAEMWGGKPDEIIGKMNMLEVIAPEQRHWLADRLNQRRKGDQFMETVEVQLIRKDGSRFWALVAPATLVDRNGRSIGFLGAMIDISERKQLEEQLQKQIEEQKKVLRLMAGREIRMAELKDVIRQLRQQLIDAGIEPMAQDPLAEEQGP
jgi:PAS domain S-box-containing protein